MNTASQPVTSQGNEPQTGPGVERALFSGRAAAPRSRDAWIAAPLGLASHAFALVAILLVSLSSGSPPLPRPRSETPVLKLAPPPPLRLGGGSLEGEELARATPVAATRPISPPRLEPARFARIPDSILNRAMDLPLGAVEAFDSGAADGFPDGLDAGVLGGVPGGIPGGVVGGTGTEVPKYPAPDVGPRPIRMPKARYTEEAIRQNVTGSVKLLAVIDERGRVRVLEVTRSVPELDAVAIDTVESRWLFQPATKNGRPIACVSRLEVGFHLR